jgi:four helix bundle protein
MTAKDFTELACWQLANELKVRVYEILKRPNVARDLKFCDQIRESVRSAPANIAEGFGKYDPPEFGRFLRIAVGSLKETQNHLRDALTQRYIALDEFREVWLLAKRARAAALALLDYLETCPKKWPRRARRAPNQLAEPEPTG